MLLACIPLQSARSATPGTERDRLRETAIAALPPGCRFRCIVMLCATLPGIAGAHCKAEDAGRDTARGPRAKFNQILNPGDDAPVWKGLPGVDGKVHSLTDYRESRVLVVVFTCNHCPMAQAYEPRLIEFARTYAPRGVQVIALNVSLSRADSLDEMKTRADRMKYPYPYLFDQTQASGRAYGATVTPHLFVLNDRRKVCYMGAFDDHLEVESVRRHYVRDAVDALLAGKEPPVRESLQRGCGIQYADREQRK